MSHPVNQELAGPRWWVCNVRAAHPRTPRSTLSASDLTPIQWLRGAPALPAPSKAPWRDSRETNTDWKEQVQLELSGRFSTNMSLRARPYLATSCGPCLSSLRQQRPATRGHPLVFGHGPPSHVCPLEKDISDLDCPHSTSLNSSSGRFWRAGGLPCSQPPALRQRRLWELALGLVQCCSQNSRGA